MREIRNRIVEHRTIPARELKRNPRNWRRHPDAQRSSVATLLEAVGWVGEALIVDTPDGPLLLDGHLRADLADDQAIPCAVVDLSDAEADLVLASLDALTSMADGDAVLLRSLIESLPLDDLAAASAIAASDLAAAAAAMLAAFPVVGPEKPLAGRTDPDAVPEPPATPHTRTGDLWRLGAHVLICGDSTDPAVLQRAVGDELVGLCVTDPPYGVDYDGGTTKRERLAGDADEHVLGVFGVIPWAPNASAYVWHADRRARHTEDALIATGFRLSAMIIWVKNVAQFGNLGARYHQQHEPMFYATRPRAYWSKITNEVTVWQHDRAPRNEYHPTQKPVALIERAIANSSPPGALVLDPFAGSGTTVIACERLGRRCATVEISPAYCDVVVKRWADFTGGEPVLERASKRRNGANP